MVTININKKDIFLIGAIIVFLVGAGIVIAYNTGGTGNPALMGHSYGEIGLPTTCTDGQVLKWSGSAWVCGGSACAFCLHNCGGAFPYQSGNIIPTTDESIIWGYNANCVNWASFTGATVYQWDGMLLCCSSSS